MMIENSNISPPTHRVERIAGGMARITLFDGVTDTGIDGGDRYQYTTYTIVRPWCDELPKMVESRLAEWLELAKGEDAPKVAAPTPAEQWRNDVENALVELADMIAGGM